MTEVFERDIVLETVQLKVGKFVVLRRLGRGGMGAVYEGYDPDLDRRVAIKTLSIEAVADLESRQRLEREARAAAKLGKHPNIITLYELGNFGVRGKPYIVMEYLEGSDLAALMGREKNMPFAEALEISIQVCRALDFAHHRGVVHRDVKPSNVRYLDDGQVKLMDFGIARVEGSDQITKSGVMIGTLHYMSPEQIQGEAIDGRADIFSTGCILYEMLAGERPFRGESATSILYKIVHHEPSRLLELDSGLPQEIQDIVDRALAKKPEARYQSAAELAQDLEQLLGVYRKTLPRLKAETRDALAELERQMREERWKEAIPLARKLVAERPELVRPHQCLRRAQREIDREREEEDIRPEDRAQQLAEISEELGHLIEQPAERTVLVGKVEAEADSEDRAAELEIGEASGRRTARRKKHGFAWLTAAAAGILVIALFWLMGSPPSAPADVHHQLRVSSTPAGASVFIGGVDSGVVTAVGSVEVPVSGAPGDEISLELRREGYAPAGIQFVLGSEPPGPFEIELRPLLRKLHLVTEPAGAKVVLDGNELPGATPMEIEVTPDELHAVKLSKEGYVDQSLELEPGGELPDEAIRLAAVGIPGSLQVVSPYSVAVRRGGVTLSQASPSSIVKGLKAGRLQVTLYAPDVFLNREYEVEIREGQTTVLEAPPLGRFSVKAKPENCTLTIDGIASGAPPILDQPIASGPHRFEFEWPDGARDVQTHEIDPERPAYVRGQVTP